MVFYCFPTVFHGFPQVLHQLFHVWFSHGFPWCSQSCSPVFPWFFHGFLYFSMVFYRLSVVFYGYNSNHSSPNRFRHRLVQVLSPEGDGIDVACSEVILPSATGQLGHVAAAAVVAMGEPPGGTTWGAPPVGQQVASPPLVVGDSLAKFWRFFAGRFLLK